MNLRNILNEKFPDEIIDKIFLFGSHPIADELREHCLVFDNPQEFDKYHFVMKLLFDIELTFMIYLRGVGLIEYKKWDRPRRINRADSIDSCRYWSSVVRPLDALFNHMIRNNNGTSFYNVYNLYRCDDCKHLMSIDLIDDMAYCDYC